MKGVRRRREAAKKRRDVEDEDEIVRHAALEALSHITEKTDQRVIAEDDKTIW